MKIIVAAFLIFIPFMTARAANLEKSPIVVSEIGAFEKAEDEWIELYNRSSRAVDITGWRFVEGFSSSSPDGVKHFLKSFQGNMTIAPEEYAIIANNAEKFHQNNRAFQGDIIDSAWGSLKEGGEKIALRNANGDILKSFTYISAPKTSLQRVDLQADDYTSANWKPHPQKHSAGSQNVFLSANAVKAEKSDTINLIKLKGDKTREGNNTSPQKLNDNLPIAHAPTIVDADASAQANEDQKQAQSQKKDGASVSISDYLKGNDPQSLSVQNDSSDLFSKIKYQPIPSALTEDQSREKILKILSVSIFTTLILFGVGIYAKYKKT